MSWIAPRSNVGSRSDPRQSDTYLPLVAKCSIVSRLCGPNDRRRSAWQEFNQTLERLENEIRTLRKERNHGPGTQTKTGGVQPASYEAIDACNGFPAYDATCPDSGKETCEGLPHLCGVSLEGLSWNKAGGWRIVPYGTLRGEMIYSQQEQAADALIFFLGPEPRRLLHPHCLPNPNRQHIAECIAGYDGYGR